MSEQTTDVQVFLYDDNGKPVCHFGNAEQEKFNVDFLLGEIIDRLIKEQNDKAISLNEYLIQLDRDNCRLSYKVFKFLTSMFDVDFKGCDVYNKKYLIIGNMFFSSFISNDKSSEFMFFSSYATDEQLMFILLEYLCYREERMKLCARCHKWFAVVNKSDELYCRRLENGTECRSIASVETRKQWQEKDSSVLKILNSIRSGMYAWIEEATGEEQARRYEVREWFNFLWKEANKVMTDAEKVEFLRSYQRGGENYYRNQ